jgi:hypothetical protein
MNVTKVLGLAAVGIAHSRCSGGAYAPFAEATGAAARCRRLEGDSGATEVLAASPVHRWHHRHHHRHWRR